MITDHRVLQLRTIRGEKVEAEVNYSDNENVNKCQVVRIKFDEKEFEIKRDELTTLLMVIGSEVDQKKLLPLKLNKIKKVERLLVFDYKASKDYKKGETVTIRAPWIDEIVTEDEVLSGAFNKRKTKHYGR